MRYCGKACQTAAWHSYHKRECALMALMSQLPAPTAEMLGLALRTVIACTEPQAAALVRDMSCDTNEERLAREIPRAAVLRQILGDRVGAGWDERALARLLVQADCNNFSIFNDLLSSLGSGVFPIGALLNHSCVGNCVMQYDASSHTQVVRCIRDTAKGEELCHSYVDQAHPKPVRALALQQQYGFSCRCPRCLGEGLYEKVERWLGAVRAQPLPQEAADDLAACFPPALLDPATCHADLVPEVELAAVTSAAAENELQEASCLHEQGQAASASEGQAMLLRALSIRLRVLHPCHLDVLASTCALQNTCAELADWPRALLFGKHVLSMYRLLYPPCHPMIGLQWYRLGDVAEQLGDAHMSRTCHEQARKVIVVCHGEESDMARALQGLGE